MKFIDLFAGIGGFRRGMELAGHKCAGFCEWDKFATASYTSMHLITPEQRGKLAEMPLKQRQKEILKDEYRNGEWYAADIRDVRAADIPKADCWCFGAPCQDFSIAGKRAGLDGDRSGLVREVFRLIDELPEEDSPEWIIYENVKGMLNSNRGFDFLAILLEMEQRGYDVQWQLLNTRYHGIPQNRERVYVVGHLRRYGPTKIFPVTGAGREDCANINILRHRKGYQRNTQVFDPQGITETLSTCQGGGREHHTAVKIFGIDYNVAGIEREYANTLIARYDNGVSNQKQQGTAIAVSIIDPQGRQGKNNQPKGIAPTLRAQTHGNLPAVCIPCLTPDRTRKRQNGRRFKENGEPSFTLTAQDVHGIGVEPKQKDIGVVWYDKYDCLIAIRKLTPRECFRLQGWTDDYFEKAEFVNSDSQLYKQAGNGVTVAVVECIARKLKKINTPKDEKSEKGANFEK